MKSKLGFLIYWLATQSPLVFLLPTLRGHWRASTGSRTIVHLNLHFLEMEIVQNPFCDKITWELVLAVEEEPCHLDGQEQKV